MWPWPGPNVSLRDPWVLDHQRGDQAGYGDHGDDDARGGHGVPASNIAIKNGHRKN